MCVFAVRPSLSSLRGRVVQMEGGLIKLTCVSLKGSGYILLSVRNVFSLEMRDILLTSHRI